MSKPPFNLQTDSIFEPFPKWQGLAIVLLAFPLLVFGPPGEGAMAWVSAISLGFAIRTFWPLRREPWFWAIMTSLGAAHVAAIIFYARLVVSQPRWAFGLAMLADIALVASVIILLATIVRRMRKTQA